MKDAKTALRTAYYSALNGQITFGGYPLKVYDKKAEDDAGSSYIIIGEDTMVSDNTFSSFRSMTTINIDIVLKRHDRVSSHELGAIANSLLNIIIPTPSTNGLPVQTGFQFTNVRVASDFDGPLAMSGTMFILRRIIRFTQTITQT